MTGRVARYRDPLTGCGYWDLAAFKELRRRCDPRCASAGACAAPDCLSCGASDTRRGLHCIPRRPGGEQRAVDEGRLQMALEEEEGGQRCLAVAMFATVVPLWKGKERTEVVTAAVAAAVAAVAAALVAALVAAVTAALATTHHRWTVRASFPSWYPSCSLTLLPPPPRARPRRPTPRRWHASASAAQPSREAARPANPPPLRARRLRNRRTALSSLSSAAALSSLQRPPLRRRRRQRLLLRCPPCPASKPLPTNCSGRRSCRGSSTCTATRCPQRRACRQPLCPPIWCISSSSLSSCSAIVCWALGPAPPRPAPPPRPALPRPAPPRPVLPPPRQPWPPRLQPPPLPHPRPLRRPQWRSVRSRPSLHTTWRSWCSTTRPCHGPRCPRPAMPCSTSSSSSSNFNTSSNYSSSCNSSCSSNSSTFRSLRSDHRHRRE